VIVSLTSAFVGFAAYPPLILGYAYCSELTFPINEATSGGLFQVPFEIFGFFATIACTEIVHRMKGDQGVLWTIISMIACSVIGTISAMLIKPIPVERNNSIRSVASKEYEGSQDYEKKVEMEKNKKI